MPSDRKPTAGSAPERALPTYRVTAPEQIAAARTVGILPQPFSVHDVAAKLGLPAGRVGLTMAFFEYCTLINPAPGRGMYQATGAAIRVAEAWAKDAEAGKAALRKAWNQTWFTKCARNRLAPGPAPRASIHARFMSLAGGGDTYRRSVDKLVELMVLSGLLIEEPGGAVRWHEQPSRSTAEETHDPGPKAEEEEQGHQGSSWSDASRSRSEAQDEEGEDPLEEERDDLREESSASAEPPPGAGADGSGPAYEHDPAALLTAPLLFRHVRSLGPEEAVELYRHLHGVLGILDRAHARARVDDGAPGHELGQPMDLSSIGRVTLEGWLNVRAFSQHIPALIPDMRSRSSAPSS